MSDTEPAVPALDELGRGLDEGFIERLAGDGTSLFKLLALSLMASGGFAIFQAATGHFLPHDTQFLGMTAEKLCSLHGCRIVHFMIHDRVSFGGVLLATGTMYLWLAEFPLRNRESWAWWALAISGGFGFLSFLAYLGYGYLDSWHGIATLAIAPFFVFALIRTRRLRESVTERAPFRMDSRETVGRTLLTLATLGIIAAGLVIMTVGMTAVFVPQDLTFMRVTRADLSALNDRLIPLIAHDRAGFGGALFSCGLAMFIAVVYARPSRSLWQALAIAGAFGFTTAIGVHPVIGYNDVVHLLPAVLGACLYAVGLVLAFPAQALAVRIHDAA